MKNLPYFLVRNRRIVLLAWVIAAAALIPFAGGAEKRLETGTRVPGSESARVSELLSTTLRSPFAHYAALIVRGVADDSSRMAVLRAIDTYLKANRVVTAVRSSLDTPDTLFVGKDGTTFMLVGFTDSVSADSILPIVRAATSELTTELKTQHPSLELQWTGELPLTVDLRRVSADDARRAEMRVLPLTLILLVVAFGAILAASLPVAFGAIAIAMTTGCIALIARVLPISILVLNVTTMLGLGLGIDYALLMVSRFREARRDGQDADVAAAIAAKHAGHSIALSGGAVLVGFAALALAPLTDIRSIALGGALVTLISVLLATTLLPGILAVLGKRITYDAKRTTPYDRWSRFAHLVVKRPVRILLIAGAPVALLAWQWRSLEVRTPRVSWLPKSIESAQGMVALDRMGRTGVVQSVRVVVELPPDYAATTFAGQLALLSLAAELSKDRRVARVVPGAASADRRMVLLEVMPKGEGGITTAMALARDIRRLDATRVMRVPDARLLVGGLPAFNADYGDAIVRATPRVVALVVIGTFIALVIGFRSVLVPLKAVLLNLVSVGAAFGAVVLVFQGGYGVRLLGLSQPLDAIFPAIPLLVFCTVFGLSMDYEVFLVSRVAEARRNGASESGSVVAGVVATGGVITSAAIVMIVVFAAFMMGEFVLMKILGFALAVAVLIDATLVRLTLGPALLRLAGRWNWWPGEARLVELPAAVNRRVQYEKA